MKLVNLALILILILPLTGALTLYGTVVDELDNVLPYSEIKIQCQEFSRELKTDKYGSFFIELNQNICMISAKKDNLVGYAQVDLTEELNQIEIKLNKKLLTSKNYWIYLIILLILIVILYLYRKKNIKNVKTNILKTLSEKEKTIINELKKHNGSLTQAKIHHNTKMPKVSLSRHIKALEKKKLIKTESIGKMKKIKLSKLFK